MITSVHHSLSSSWCGTNQQSKVSFVNVQCKKLVTCKKHCLYYLYLIAPRMPGMTICLLNCALPSTYLSVKRISWISVRNYIYFSHRERLPKICQQRSNLAFFILIKFSEDIFVDRERCQTHFKSLTVVLRSERMCFKL